MKTKVKEKMEQINDKLDALIKKLEQGRNELNNIIQEEDEKRAK